MISRIASILMLLIASVNVIHAQSTQDTYLNKRNIIDRMSRGDYGQSSSAIPVTGPPPPGVKGDVYLTENYNLSFFQLFEKDQVIDGYYAKLDLQKNEFDLSTKQGVRVLSGVKVRSYAFIDSLTNAKRVFANSRQWKNQEGTTVEGFMEILSEGSVSLLKKTEVIFKKANYHQALAVGSKDHQFIKKVYYYYLREGVFYELPNRKNFAAIFTGKEAEMEKFMSQNALRINQENDLVKIFRYYNSENE